MVVMGGSLSQKRLSVVMGGSVRQKRLSVVMAGSLRHTASIVEDGGSRTEEVGLLLSARPAMQPSVAFAAAVVGIYDKVAQ